MAYTCDNPHPEPVTAFAVMSMPETGDTTALCAPCLLEWAYALLAGTEQGTELIKARMIEIAAEAKAEGSKPKRGARRAPETGTDPEKDTDAPASAPSTAGTD